MTPVEKFSITMSLDPIRSRTRSRARSSFRFRVMLRLLGFSSSQETSRWERSGACPRLDLDDLGAHRREVLGADRAGHHPAKVDDPHARERPLVVIDRVMCRARWWIDARRFGRQVVGSTWQYGVQVRIVNLDKEFARGKLRGCQQVRCRAEGKTRHTLLLRRLKNLGPGSDATPLRQ